MASPLILASSSAVRAALLGNAGLSFTTQAARVDEDAARAGLEAEGATPRDLADALAEMKARKVSDRNPGALVVGADQVLDCAGRVLAKPRDPAEARDHLRFLAGRTHRLHSAAVACQDGRPLWRHVGVVTLTLHAATDAALDDYVARNWDSIRHAVGCYKIEEEGVRLISRIDGDFFHILGLPLIELLTWLRVRGDIPA